MYMTYNHNIFRAVGEFSPDDEWWGKCKQVPIIERKTREKIRPGKKWYVSTTNPLREGSIEVSRKNLFSEQLRPPSPI